jgi:hypothetical protein
MSRNLPPSPFLPEAGNIKFPKRRVLEKLRRCIMSVTTVIFTVSVVFGLLVIFFQRVDSCKHFHELRKKKSIQFISVVNIKR